ncbi:hypothetical protein HF086_006744 [Spodoptera exigua]|uniref:Rab-GAP TBC domain-containing protein n=1 Tax=Spodoptera exigua TaxID=7107 RepID=A0A922M6B7_SPOEX|nr:hypothetical protein HF086_006744 [Spodoptera exigua]
MSAGTTTPPSVRRPILNFKRSLNASSDDGASSNTGTGKAAGSSAKDYVESLHQNSTATLLYGKNNVRVQPKDVEEPMPGYLSLHQTAAGLVIKWTPNQLMNGYAESEGIDKRYIFVLDLKLEVINTLASVYWAMSLQVCVWEVVYVHVHRSQASDALILVGQDGVQRPPIHFPKAMRHSLLERAVQSPPRTPRRPLASTSTTSSDSSTMSVDCPPSAGINGHPPVTPIPHQPVEQAASIELVCSTMRRQIISRAFYGWLAYCRHLSTVRTHLSGLVHPIIVPRVHDKDEVYRLVYYGGVQHDIRRHVWPYLLGYYEFGSTAEERAEQDAACRRQYETTMSEWLCVEAIVRQRDREATAASIARLTEASGKLKPTDNNDTSEVFEDDCSVISDNPPIVSPEPSENEQRRPDKPVLSRAPSIDEVDNIEMDSERDKETKQNGETENGDNRDVDVDSLKDLDEDVHLKSVVDNPDMRRESIAEIKRLAEEIVQKGDGRGLLCSVDSAHVNGTGSDFRSSIDESQPSPHQQHTSVIITNPSVDLAAGGSPASGGTTGEFGFILISNRLQCWYTKEISNELVESFALNLHRIEKDVQRCDRNYPFFTDENLDKLRNIMCTSLIQILDCELYELMHAHGDYTHFYFCYRWFLLDFKRELLYQDVFAAWELIWAARHVASEHMVLFIALALLETYRDVILANTMDFTDIIKFFNEMAERHDASAVLSLARDLVLQVQTLIENK